MLVAQAFCKCPSKKGAKKPLVKKNSAKKSLVAKALVKKPLAKKATKKTPKKVVATPLKKRHWKAGSKYLFDYYKYPFNVFAKRLYTMFLNKMTFAFRRQLFLYSRRLLRLIL
ncbi:uncharacterized protein ColSpa_05200 [Colletotrichum spaethianum]|uniref:Uncharacterized protein n=1 Tax=Colletotrichum spaethianum TaxID=700344 RepID=A0AA37P7P7_9PEZI|nr:uncharacterized protein ColSpa_05200 [Colletotrichum spaethianum]GKT45019.1 hypothetical protein ColSpa_05200 [Colletotrichum spaethianum]